MSVCVSACVRSFVFVVKTLPYSALCCAFFNIAFAFYISRCVCLAQCPMHPCLHSCPARGLAFRYSFRSTCGLWHSSRSCLQSRRQAFRSAAPTAVLTRPQSGLNIPGIGDLSKLANVDLSDVPDGRYREVEVGVLCCAKCLCALLHKSSCQLPICRKTFDIGRMLQAVSYVSRRRMDQADFDPYEIDTDGLPLVYNEERIASFWKGKPGMCY